MPIKISNLSYTYSKKTPFEYQALRDISLEINDGDFVAFVGHTGSGKSTLIQHLNALLQADSGIIEIDEFTLNGGKKKNKQIKKLRKKVGVVFQFPEYQLFEESVEKDVMYGPRNFKVDKETALKKAHEVLDYVGLDESYYKRSPFELSGGEKRRVAIAGVLSFEPDILVLDEPTAGLDPDGQRMILSLLKKMNQDGHTIIIVTHDMDIVLKYCNKVFVLKDGELAFNGTPHELFTNNPSEYSIEIPKLYQLVEALNKKGHHLDASKINNIHDLVSSFKKDK